MTTSSPDHAPKLDPQQVLAELEQSLLQQPDLDAADRDTMLRHFEAALQDPAVAAAGATGPDRAAWIETLDLLQRERVIAAEDREALVRNFDDAMHALQDDTLKLAAEYAALGQAAAGPGAWQQRRAATAPSPAPATPGLPPSLAALPDRRRR